MPDIKQLSIEMPYIGACLSVNHYKHGYYTKSETRIWMDALGWLVKTAHLEDWKLPLTVQCDGRFKDKRSTPDLSNLSKVILDAIQDASGVNDSNMRWRDGEKNCGAPPTLRITIREYIEGK